MDWKEVGKKVAVAAPALGMAMAGPGGAAVGAMVAAALDVDANPGAVAAMASSPDAAVRLREVELKHAEVLASLAVQQVQAELLDVQNARNRDVKILESGRSNGRANVMIVGAVVGLLSCLAVLVEFQGKVPGEVVGIVSTVAGLFGACLRDAFQFEFGSSRGSLEKSSTISELMTRS